MRVDFTAMHNFEWDTAVQRSNTTHGELRRVGTRYIGDPDKFELNAQRFAEAKTAEASRPDVHAYPLWGARGWFHFGVPARGRPAAG